MVILKTNYGDLTKSQYSQFNYFVNLINDIDYNGELINLNILFKNDYSNKITLSELINIYNNDKLDLFIKYYEIYWILEFIYITKITDRIFNSLSFIENYIVHPELSLELSNLVTLDNYDDKLSSGLNKLLIPNDIYYIINKLKRIKLSYIVDIIDMDKLITEFIFVSRKKYKYKKDKKYIMVDSDVNDQKISKWAENKLDILLSNYKEQNEIIFQIINLRHLIPIDLFINKIYNNRNKINNNNVNDLFHKFGIELIDIIQKYIPVIYNSVLIIMYENEKFVHSIIDQEFIQYSEYFRYYINYRYIIKEDDPKTIKRLITKMDIPTFLNIVNIEDLKYHEFYHYLINGYNINIKKFIYVDFYYNCYYRKQLIELTYKIKYKLSFNLNDIKNILEYTLGDGDDLTTELEYHYDNFNTLDTLLLFNNANYEPGIKKLSKFIN